MLINQSALELVKEFEGLRLSAYQDSVGGLDHQLRHHGGGGLWDLAPRAGMTITAGQGLWFSGERNGER